MGNGETMRRKYATGLLLAAVVLAAAACRKDTTTDTQAVESGTESSAVASTEVITVPAKPETETTGEKPTAPSEEGGEGGYDWEKTAIIATDIHYLSRELTDYGSGFQYMVDHGDGKVMTYVEPIVDAFIAEVIAARPDLLILTGDLTYNGEMLSHKELAAKLYDVEKSGIPVLVIPGNHDANNPSAAEFRNEDRLPAEKTTPGQFREIYQDFGYNEALYQDENSLSYIYQVDEYNWLFMLDSCLFYPNTHEEGSVHPETLKWIEEKLDEAWGEGVNVVMSAHHNLLDQSEVYAFNCTIETGEELTSILGEWGVRLFLSGHLHVQHHKEDEQNGVYEIVTSSLSTPRCQYGVLTFRDDSSFSYYTQAIDIEGWAKKNNRTEQDLLQFEEFKEPFLRKVFYNQAYDVLSKVTDLKDQEAVMMSEFYSDLNYHYYQGTAYLVAEEARQTKAYAMWDQYSADNMPAAYIEYILDDALGNYNMLEVE